MFLSAVIPLTALNTLAPENNHFLGREAHALFLDLVRRADPALSESLHASREDKPFTVSSLIDPRARRTLVPNIRAGESYEWRITAIDPRLTQLLMERILPNLPGEMRLASAQFSAGKPITDHTAHPWVGIAEPDAFVDKWFSAAARIEKQVELEFASPTAHRQIHRNILFPQPAALWRDWLRAWNWYAQPAFEEDLLARVEADVSISRYTLATQIVDYGEFVERGWMGRCAFQIFSDVIALRRVVQLLADFAFYCGTGYKTTHGMGLTRKLAP